MGVTGNPCLKIGYPNQHMIALETRPLRRGDFVVRDIPGPFGSITVVRNIPGPSRSITYTRQRYTLRRVLRTTRDGIATSVVFPSEWDSEFTRPHVVEPVEERHLLMAVRREHNKVLEEATRDIAWSFPPDPLAYDELLDARCAVLELIDEQDRLQL